MKRCTKCVLPETYPGIQFDNDGVCNRCTEWSLTYGSIDYQAQRQKLEALISEKKQEALLYKTPFDVIVPISGGKDSAYVLYIMKEIFGCRVLAVNYHNTMQTELAYRNLVHLVDTFDVDFRMLNIRPSLLKKAYNRALSEEKEFCTICNCTGYWLFLSFLSDQFAKYGYVPMIVGGWSRKYEYDPQINTLNFANYRRFLERNGLIDEFCQTLNLDVLDELTEQKDVRHQNSGGFIQLPDYWEWDHDEMLRVLKSKGWQPMKDKDTHFDCWASPLADMLETIKYGLNQKSTILATMVRAGKAERRKAILEEELSVYEPIDWQLIERFVKHAGFTLEEYEQLKPYFRNE
jgi:hypothetical protein